jgi:hypothetical protein
MEVPMSDEKETKGWMLITKQIVQIFTCLSFIMGIFLGLGELNKSRRELYVAVRILKLSSLQHQNRIFEQNREIRHKRQEFVKKYRKIKAEKREQEYIQQLFLKHGTGRCVYLSEELKVFSAVGRHYEYLGALVRLEYIDFPLVFEVLAFPDDFLDETRKLRQRIQDEWDGPGKRNNEFWKNFIYLRELYCKERKKTH